ncbi:MAG: branched-chain amino acid ABC transporter permease [Sedimentisphaerales bacterium]|nr:branched-chain amino acid ABC transporter permease [Sedimentisphaerales bacterium]
MQICLNTLHNASVIALIAVGFALIFRVTHFFHFAHAILYTGGAYLAFAFRAKTAMPMWLAIPLALLAAAFLGGLIEWLVYRPLRDRKASPLILLLASLGLYIVLQNVISMLFGDDTKVIRSPSIQPSVNILGAQITPIQLATILLSLLLLLIVTILLKKASIGRGIRAVASDATLAELSGIDSSMVILIVMGLGSFLAAVAGILVAFDVDMTPTMGMQPFMLAVVATIVGGVRNLWGIALASLLLASAQQLTAWQIGAQWQEFAAFVVLVAYLLARPKGVLGAKV